MMMMMMMTMMTMTMMTMMMMMMMTMTTTTVNLYIVTAPFLLIVGDKLEHPDYLPDLKMVTLMFSRLHL